MDWKLLFQAITKYLLGLALVALLLFLPAGTLYYPKGWLLLAILFGPMLPAGLLLLWRKPELLRRRLNAREPEPEQRRVLAWSGLMFLAAFVLAGLNFRFGWLSLPDWLSWAAGGVFLLGYLLYAEVMRENEYLSRTVEVQDGQKLIDSGLYGLVRHPMYAATLLLFLSMPLVLGSLPSLAVMLAYLPIIGKRMANEEAVLCAGLPGYADYRKRVKYKVLPGIW
ncbi:MAG: isoprenylcysteine carboxylmethyltransferase family protein [Oscillospiraceae bacterium]|nr:isoprenylcysteine carboxylmethyltransferase family protein [Oscillospiraceae bacterium]